MGAFRRLCAPLAVRVVRGWLCEWYGGPGHVVVTNEPAQTVGTFVLTAHICASLPSTAVTCNTSAGRRREAPFTRLARVPTSRPAGPGRRQHPHPLRTESPCRRTRRRG